MITGDGTETDFLKEILLTGFCGTSSELFVKKAGCKSLILPNDRILDSRILLTEVERQDYKYIFSFGQKPNIRDKVYIETVAKCENKCLHTNFAYDNLQVALRKENITVRISDHAGTSFCNTLYWNVLEYIRNRELRVKMIFLHIPFCKNITAPEDFYERIWKGVGNCLLSRRNS